MNGTLAKRLRNERGETQRQVAIATGLTIETIKMLEHGRAKNPTLKTMKAVADHFGVTVDQLLSGEK